MKENSEELKSNKLEPTNREVDVRKIDEWLSNQNDIEYNGCGWRLMPRGNLAQAIAEAIDNGEIYK